MQKDIRQLQKIKKLLNAKTAEEYIDISMKSNLSQGEKATATRLWLKDSGFKIEDIAYARNRHPHWKKIKQKNHLARTKKRIDKFNFSTARSKAWDKEELRNFLDLNDKTTDVELAKNFQRSIPSIQAIRRRINIIDKIFFLEHNRKPSRAAYLRLVISDEKVLRRKLDELQK